TVAGAPGRRSACAPGVMAWASIAGRACKFGRRHVMTTVPRTAALVAAAFLLSAPAGHCLRREPPPRTPHHVAAPLQERGLPVRFLSPPPVGPGVPSPVAYLTGTEQSLEEIQALPFGRWARWQGTVYCGREEGPDYPTPPVAFGDQRHHLRRGQLVFYGDPELLRQIA